MMTPCSIARADLLQHGGELLDLDGSPTAAHLPVCGDCTAFARGLRADATLLRMALAVTAPAHVGPPVIGSRPLPSLAIAEGRQMPWQWLAVPAAAAAVAMFLGALFSASTDAPSKIDGVTVEEVAGGDWAGVTDVASTGAVTSPAGPMVDQLFGTLAPTRPAPGNGEEGR
jgi:anti-sigma factor RsiW